MSVSGDEPEASLPAKYLTVKINGLHQRAAPREREICVMRNSIQRRRRTKPIMTNVINAADRFPGDGLSDRRFEALDAGTWTWWRKYPAHAFARHAVQVAADLDRLSAVQPMLRNALRGDVASAIALAIEEQGSCPPFAVETDLVMTALMRCALDGSVTAAVVMANVTKCCAFDHGIGDWITRSWFEFEAPDGAKRKDSAAVRRLASTVVDTEWLGNAIDSNDEGL